MELNSTVKKYAQQGVTVGVQVLRDPEIDYLGIIFDVLEVDGKKVRAEPFLIQNGDIEYVREN